MKKLPRILAVSSLAISLILLVIFMMAGSVLARENETDIAHFSAKDGKDILHNEEAADTKLGEPGVIAFLTGPNEGAPLDIALAFVQENKEALGLTSEDLLDVVVTDQYVSSHNGVTHIYLQQRYDGIEIADATLTINIAADGSVINLSSRFVGDLAQMVEGTAVLSAVEAVETAATHLDLTLTEALVVEEVIGGAAQAIVLSDGGISLEAIPARLVYQPTEAGLRLAWELAIYELDALHYWQVRVDAGTGDIVAQYDLVVHEDFLAQAADAGHDLQAQAATYAPVVSQPAVQDDFSLTPDDYLVYAWPVESPQHTSPAPPADARTLETDPATSASPFGWHDTDGSPGAEFTVTEGNNVNAYEDGNNPGFQPDCGGTISCTFPIDLTQHPDTYESAAIANLFYWNNIIHDVWYGYGFDEVSGNFQENNYGASGLGSDSVNAEAQDGSGTCNANMFTPADGSNPRMQMYLCGIASPTRDGDLDNLVIVHEYAHGISNRLTGGPSTASCLNNAEQMGEGWSDWYGLVMSMETGDTGPDPRGVGTYLFGQPPDGPGIRPAPYSTDFLVNAFTYGDIPGQAIPHGVGFVWATMLWEMTWELIDEYGFDADIYNGTGGNNLAMQLVTDGMKLQPCSPGFVDGRDAILQADLVLTGGTNQCTIWDAFARRGLGFSADQGSSGSTGDGTEAFDIPVFCLGPTGTLVGTVTAQESGDPIEGATVTADGTSVTTDANGDYTMLLSVGNYTVTAEAADRLPVTVFNVPIMSGTTTTQDFVLEGSILTYSPPEIEEFMVFGDVVTNSVTLTNTGPLTVQWSASIGNFVEPAFRLQNGTGEWLYRAEEGVLMAANNGTEEMVTVYPSAYRWQPVVPSGVDVLVYGDDVIHTAPNTFPDQALQALGIAYTAHYDGDWTGFESSLNSGSWDIVLVANDNFGPPPSTLTALNAYVNGGGKLIYHSWTVGSDSSNPLWTTLGFTWAGNDFDPPAPVFWWQPGHPAFNSPESVPELTMLTGGIYGTYGQNVEPLSGAEALAGYTTPGPDPNQAALILHNDGSTIFKGFLDGQNSADLDSDSVQDGLELWINLITGIQSGFSGSGWATAVPNSGTIAPNSTDTFDVVFDGRSLIGVGDYTADLTFSGSFINDVPVMPLTMHLSCPTCGVLTGVITDAWTGISVTADISITGPGGFNYMLTSDSYSIGVQPGLYNFLVTAPGYLSQTAVLTSTQGVTTVHNFALVPDVAILEFSPPEIEEFMVIGEIVTNTVTVSNTGTGTLNFNVNIGNFNEPGDLIVKRRLEPLAPIAGLIPDFSPPAEIGPLSVRSAEGQALLADQLVTPDAWTGATSMPSGAGVVRYAHAQCPGDTNSFYVISGVDEGFSVTANAWRYDADTDTWNALAAFPTPQEGPAAVCHEGFIYVVGGGGTNQFFIYDINGNSWSPGPALPRGVWGAAMGAWNGQIFMIGGDNDFTFGGTSNQVNIYDIGSGSWVGTGASMPTAAGTAGDVQLGSHVYVVGGWGDSSPATNVDLTQRYDMSTNTWELGPTFSSARADFALAATGMSLYAIAGDANGGGPFDPSTLVETLDHGNWPGGSWTDIGDPIPSGLTALHGGFCTESVTGGEVWAVAGFNGGSIVGTNQYRASEGCFSGGGSWVRAVPNSGTVPPFSVTTFDVIFDARSLIEVGDYSAELSFSGNFINDPATMPLTMHLSCPTCGFLNGSITDDTSGLPLVANINVMGPGGFDVTLNGDSYNIAVQPGVYDFTVTASGYLSETATVTAVQGVTVTTDFSLIPDVSILSFSPPEVEEFMEIGDVVTNTVTVTNSGAATLEFDVNIGNYAGPALALIPLETTQGSGEWLYRSEKGISIAANNGTDEMVTVYPSAYRWTPAVPSGASVLLYADDAIHTAPNTFPDQALQAMGIAYTAHYDGDWTGFESSLNSGTWDIVLVANDNFGPPPTVLSALNTYVTDGGKLIYHSWTVGADSSNPLWATLGFTWSGDDFDPPAPVYWWEPGHSIFNSPESVPEFTMLTGGIYGIYGQNVEPLPDAEALAGYTTPGPDPNQAALILANNGNTLYKGFLDGQNSADLDSDSVPDGLELWTNMIEGIQSGFGAGNWAYAVPDTGTIPPYSVSTFALVFDARSLIAVGDYTAELSFSGNFINDPGTMPLTMHVSCPTCGFLNGTILDAWTGISVTADISITGPSGFNVELSGNSYDIAVQPGVYNFIVSANGYLSETASVIATQGTTVTTDFALTPIVAWLDYSPTSFEETVVLGTIFAQSLTIANTGTVPFDYALADIETGSPFDPFVEPLATTCPPDAAGYTCTDSTEPGGLVTYNFEDISATGTPISLGDDQMSGPVPVGFTFNYYGVDYNDAYVSSNGFLSMLAGQYNGCCTGFPLPTAGDPDAVIAAWWEDLNPSAGGTIHYETLGTAPFQYFVVQFTDMPHFPSGTLTTFQYKLFEGSNNIEVHYREAPSDGGTHSAGIENESGTIGLQYYLGAGGLTTPLAVCYLYPGQFKCGSGGSDALWLHEVPISGTIPAGSAVSTDLVFDASVLTTTGTYTAEVFFNGSFDNGVEPALVVMHVVSTGTYLVDLSPDDAMTGAPGTAVAYTVWITNNGNVGDVIDLSISGNIWTTNLSVSSVSLGAGASTSFMVTVNVPAGAAGGSMDAVTVTATSQGDPGESDTTTLTTTANTTYGVEVSADMAMTGTVGTTVTYMVWVTNTGNAADTFNLAASGNNWTVTHAADVTVAAGGSVAVSVSVAVPAGASDGDMDAVTITATSQGDPGVSASTTLTTTAVELPEPPGTTIYLPFVVKDT